MEFKTKLLLKKEVADDTMSFSFEKPSDFTYKSGQYIQIALINPPETDAEGDTRTFSLASAPYEEHIMITTRLRDTAFKRVLRQQESGYEVNVRGPMGVFTLYEDTSVPSVFLVGGIGITPFRSMILQATHDKSLRKLILFYSNHSKEDTAFYDELEAVVQTNPNFTFVPIMTRDETWQGEKGHIDKAMIEKFIQDISKPIFYTAGPQAMVETMKKILQESGVKDDHIKFENFTGY